MNPISAAIEPYVLYIKLAIVLAIGGALFYQHWRIGQLKAEQTLYAAATQGYADAQKTNLDTIANLQATLHDVIEINRMDEARASAASTAAMLRQQSIESELTAKTRELANVYATNADARVWGAIGVDGAVLARLPKPAAAHGH